MYIREMLEVVGERYQKIPTEKPRDVGYSMLILRKRLVKYAKEGLNPTNI